jgi:threonine/homoserine/homoserine lactone efflux protein
LREGFVVGFLNPKSLVFYIAVFPHFVDRTQGSVVVQMLVFGAIFCVMAIVSDGTWGFLAGTAREWLADSPGRLVPDAHRRRSRDVHPGALILIGALRSL